MYAPIPGFAHLQLYVPADPISYDRQPTPMDEEVKERAQTLIRQVIETAAGRRPLSHVRSERFPPRLANHLSAWLRTRGFSLPARHDLVAVHAHANGEFYGTATIGVTQHAFTGSYKQHRLVSFRLL